MESLCAWSCRIFWLKHIAPTLAMAHIRPIAGQRLGAKCSFPGCGLSKLALGQYWLSGVRKPGWSPMKFRQERAHIIQEMQATRRLVRISMDEEFPIQCDAVSHCNTYVEWLVGRDVVNALIRFDLIWCGLVWIGLVWFDLIVFDLVWLDMACCGVMWFGLSWFDLNRFALERRAWCTAKSLPPCQRCRGLPIWEGCGQPRHVARLR